MLKNKKIIFLVLSFILLTIIFCFASLENKNTNKKLSAKLITSVHKDLPLKFDSEQKNVILKPGEITNNKLFSRKFK